MLCDLAIQDIVLIDRLHLHVGGGLTALTGETGAGKSILLDSLSLATGAKADKGLVRHGAEKGIVAATFDADADHPVWALLENNGLSTEDDTVTLRRIQMADGKSRAFINDQACSIALLREVGEALIEIHGQHQSLGFLNAAVHRDLLDQFADLTDDSAAVARAWSFVQALEEDAAQQARDRDQALREADYLRHVSEELARLNPVAGEEEELAERRAVLMAAEKVAGDLRDALDVLEDDGSGRRLSTAAAQIERAASRLPDADAAPLTEAVARLDAAMEEFAGARAAVVAAADAFVQNPEELNVVEERLFALRAAGRKFSRLPDRLASYREEVEAALEKLDRGDADFAALNKKIGEARAQFDKLATALSAKRTKAAKSLSAAVKKELAPLKLGHAVFKADVSETEPGAHGVDKVRFLISTNPGTPLGPLSAIASGGELSRFVLALKAVLVAKEGRTVIIFDEVDSGVGGAVADAVGERLARIAEGSQVLVVTHSPQVAARGQAHWKVEKSGKKALLTAVRPLKQDERIEEIARMLSGAEVTDEARAAARKLLASAHTEADRSAA
ncbi:DNA repair protein RecN [Parvularcula sp. LCG005]|uniref:DNA repair protein RecN n=1 Tax=Parvularcula sp. LCG005 TaxID=3078805 RepID=UPI002941F766|nr:DNA repair protein RecN [Parvularcula sp. LCG005]WOI52256.1 DNA repair protein RecN [Parvularcula sp. LCG005]